MACDESLVGRIRDVLACQSDIEVKKMFGGIGFLLRDKLLVAVWKKLLIARIGLEAWQSALREPCVREFDITGRVMKGWVMVEPEGLEEDVQLKGWIQRALQFVEQLPGK